MRVPVYLVVIGSGQFGPDEVEYEMIVAIKLTHGAAMQVASDYPGAVVKKMIADKEVPIS